MVARRLYARRQLHAHDDRDPAARRVASTLTAVVWWHSGGFNLLVFIGLGIFWLVKRQMPYDLI